MRYSYESTSGLGIWLAIDSAYIGGRKERGEGGKGGRGGSCLARWCLRWRRRRIIGIGGGVGVGKGKGWDVGGIVVGDWREIAGK